MMTTAARPSGPPVSICSLKLTNSMLSRIISSRTSRKCLVDRAIRSQAQTRATSNWPRRASRIIASSPGRRAFVPEIVSVSSWTICLSTIDPLGNQTAYGYTDSWSNQACAPSGTTAAFRTSVTDAMGYTSTSQYYACTGLVGSTTDINNNTTTISYDSFGRETQISFPDGGSKAFCYSDDPNGSCYSASVLSSTETDAINSSTNLIQTTVYEGLGRNLNGGLLDPLLAGWILLVAGQTAGLPRGNIHL